MGTGQRGRRPDPGWPAEVNRAPARLFSGLHGRPCPLIHSVSLAPVGLRDRQAFWTPSSCRRWPAPLSAP